jgi:hypothetical protein
VGTGRPERREPVVYKEFIGRSWIRLAEDLFRAAEDGQSALQDQMVGRLAGAHYWPFQTTLGGWASYLMDDCSRPSSITCDLSWPPKRRTRTPLSCRGAKLRG